MMGGLLPVPIVSRRGEHGYFFLPPPLKDCLAMSPEPSHGFGLTASSAAFLANCLARLAFFSVFGLLAVGLGAELSLMGFCSCGALAATAAANCSSDMLPALA